MVTKYVPAARFVRVTVEEVKVGLQKSSLLDPKSELHKVDPTYRNVLKFVVPPQVEKDQSPSPGIVTVYCASVVFVLRVQLSKIPGGAPGTVDPVNTPGALTAAVPSLCPKE